MYEPPTSPQLIGGVLDGAVKLFKTSFSQTIGLAVVAGVGGSLWRLFDNSLERALSMMDGTFDPALEIPGWNLLALPISLVVSIYFYLGVLARMDAVAHGRPITVGEALWRGLRRFPALLLCLLAYSAILGLSIFPTVLLIVAAGPIGLLGFLMMVPALVLLVYWYFAPFLLVAENIGAVAALRRSFNLVRGNWGRTVVILMVAYFVLLVVMTLVAMVGAAVVRVAGFVDIGIDAAVFAIEAVSSAVTIPFMVSVSLAMLYDLKLRRGGADLAARIEAVGR